MPVQIVYAVPKGKVRIAADNKPKLAIIATMVTEMPEAHRHFLVGFKRGEPDWELLGIPDARHLPAVLWKQRNLDRLPSGKRRELADALERALLP